MTATRERITEILLRIQGAFLDTPGLAITQRDARLLFDVDDVTCAAIMNALVESNVLERTPAGKYVRYFPMQNAA